MQIRLKNLILLGTATLLGSSAIAQQVVEMGFVSVGRGAPLLVDANNLEATGASLRGAGGGFPRVGQPLIFTGMARNGESPEGIEPLEIDLFTSKDFYQDSELWSDPRYFRCNTTNSIENMWGGNGTGLIGDNPPMSAAWGRCDRDYPRESIVSPYGFTTAQEHYEALMAETKSRGGPTQHTYATVPGEWTGQYQAPGRTPNNRSWYNMGQIQASTLVSLLTKEYQTRLVQEAYHHGNTNAAQWPSQYCWPEGFMRRWHAAATWEHNIMVTPNMVQVLAGVARNFITSVHIGREFNLGGAVPRLGADVPRWYGETIGFWDKDTLITWTSNVQGWKSHAAPEHSNFMQTIEIYAPNHDDNGNFLGLNHETVLYDPEAYVEPVRIVRNFVKSANFDEADPYVFIECNQTIFPIDGTATPVSPNAVIEYEIPDMYGRPWAKIWEDFFEQDMQRPEGEGDDIFSFE